MDQETRFRATSLEPMRENRLFRLVGATGGSPIVRVVSKADGSDLPTLFLVVM